MNKLHEQVERKFVETFDVSDWEVETEGGWVDIEKSNKTIEYDVWRLELSNGQWLECADNHIVFKPWAIDGDDYNKEEVFVKDLRVGDYVIVNDEDSSWQRVKSVTKLDRKEHMYDLTVGGDHTYFTNDILSHNTLILGNTAINAVKDGKNVLYITFEISQDELRRRLDSAFTDFSVKNITKLKDKVKQQIVSAKKDGAVGRFIIKEFPPASVSALDLESYLNTLHMKRDFKPDVIILDYLGIMKPCSKESSNSYERGKAVCEEIRAFSDRHKCPVWSAVQTNRGAYGQSNVEMDNIADSMGIAHTADLLISLAQPDELKEEDKMKFEVIKSRISKTGAHGIVNIDYDKMKIINTGSSEDRNIIDTINEGLDDLKSDNGIS